MNRDGTIVVVKNVYKTYEGGRIKALRGINLSVKEGEFLAIMGPSGSGKSTLLHLIGAMERPDSGLILVDGTDLQKLKDASRFRAQTVGFVFQLHNLIPTLTAVENVEIPMFESGLSRKERRFKAISLLQLVGLEERLFNFPPQLSGGERQRVAIARSLANDPRVLLADEPTGNLDSDSSHKIIKLLRKIQETKKATIILVTHDTDMAEHADRAVKIKDGVIIG
jgi:putative ABC transport system ATP-binding protein